MSGKRTFAGGPHASAVGGLIVVARDRDTLRRASADPHCFVVALLPDVWHDAEAALGRTLEAHERGRITATLELHGPLIRDAIRHRVTQRDQVATLRAFAAGAAPAAYRDCDDGTRALLLTALLALGIRETSRLVHSSADDTARAARAILDALDRVPRDDLDAVFVRCVHEALPSRAGRPPSPVGPLLRQLVTIWRDCGGTATSFAERPGYAPRVVTFVNALCTAAGIVTDERQTAKLLRAHVPPQGR